MTDPAIENLIDDAFDRIRALERIGHLERAVEARCALEVIREEYNDAIGDIKSATTDLSAAHDEQNMLQAEIKRLRDELRDKVQKVLNIQTRIGQKRLRLEEYRHKASQIGRQIGAIGTMVDAGSLEGVLSVWQVAVDYFDMSTVFALRCTCKEMTALAMMPTLIVGNLCDSDAYFHAPIARAVLDRAFKETRDDTHTLILDSLPAYGNYGVHFAYKISEAAQWDAVVIWGPRQMCEYRSGAESLLFHVQKALEHHPRSLLMAVCTDQPLTRAHQRTMHLLAKYLRSLIMTHGKCVIPLTPFDLFSNGWTRHGNSYTRVLLRPTVEKQLEHAYDARFSHTICLLAPGDQRIDVESWYRIPGQKVVYVECEWLRGYQD